MNMPSRLVRDMSVSKKTSLSLFNSKGPLELESLDTRLSSYQYIEATFVNINI
jgi:hypothetical protein